MFSQFIESTTKKNVLVHFESYQKDRALLLQKWVECFHALIEERQLDELFRHIFLNKVYAKKDLNTFNPFVNSLIDEVNFLYELF